MGYLAGDREGTSGVSIRSRWPQVEEEEEEGEEEEDFPHSCRKEESL